MIFWICAIIVLAIIEAVTVGLTTIWFVVSGLVALIVSFFCDNFLIQFGIFVVLGIILLITTRPLLKKFIKVEKVKTNLDRVVGMEGIVTEDIVPLELGEVKVDGKKWSAISDEKIEKDSKIVVLEIDGVKLKVKKKEE